MSAPGDIPRDDLLYYATPKPDPDNPLRYDRTVKPFGPGDNFDHYSAQDQRPERGPVTAKRATIATLLRCGRPDLANIVAYQTVGKIVLPPRKIEPYVRGFVKKLRAFDTLVAQLKDRFEKLDRDHPDYGSRLREVTIDDLDGYDLMQFVNVLGGKTYSNKSKLQDFADSIDLSLQVMKDGTGQALNDLENLATRFDWVVEHLDHVADVAKGVTKLRGTGWIGPALNDYYRYAVDRETFDNEHVDYVKKADLELLAKVLMSRSSLHQLAAEVAKRVRALRTQAIEKHQDDAWKPAMEKVETMYHASVDAKKIAAKGFDRVVPSVKGLGGSQSDKGGKNAISFTSDLYVAKEVMRALKEAIMVARGDVKARHILEWADKQRIKDKVLDSPFLPADFAKKQNWDDPVVAFALYMAYLSWSKRYDPGFFGVPSKFVALFKSLNPRDVGIIVASVNTQNPDIVYLPAMQEYRVPPEAVVSVDKLIRG
jgi:hypothetical protein